MGVVRGLWGSTLSLLSLWGASAILHQHGGAGGAQLPSVSRGEES